MAPTSKSPQALLVLIVAMANLAIAFRFPRAFFDMLPGWGVALLSVLGALMIGASVAFAVHRAKLDASGQPADPSDAG